MSPAEDVVGEATRPMRSIELPELLQLAELQVRVDRKYFVAAETFRQLAAELAGGWRVLEIDRRRIFGYESVYFDTARLNSYRAHLQRRRRRYKIRTRTYTDSGLCLFEVKLEGHRDGTVKHRIAHPVDQRHRLTRAAVAHLEAALHHAYGLPAPRGLRPTVITAYRRATFASAEGARMTCDVALVCRNDRAAVRDSGTYVLVETKSATGASSADRLLREAGVRTVSVSKYCVGIAALHPEVPSNPWHHTMRRYVNPTPVAG